MGMFGKFMQSPSAQLGAAQASAPRQPMTWADRLNLIGAGMQDVGGGGDHLMQMQQMLAARQMQGQKMALGSQLAGMFGGQAPGQPGPAAAPGPGASGPTAGAPDPQSIGPMLARAAAMGIDITPYLSLYEKMQPDVQVANGVAYDRHDTKPGSRIGVNLTNVNGRLVDTQNPTNANVFVPSVKEGQEVVYNAQGQPIGVRDLQGNNMTFDAQMRQREADNGAMNARSNAQQANTGASRNAYEQGTGNKPKPWDRSWK